MGRRRGTFGVFGGSKRKASVARHKRTFCHSYRRALRFEPLEDRRVLAVVTVDALSDTMDSGDGVTSLREAVATANLAAGADTIEFAAFLGDSGPATILLAQGEIAITEALTIDARPLAQGVTIDANLLSRVFNITATTGDFTLAGLTLINGKTTGNNSLYPDSTYSGGALRSASSGLFTIDHCTVRGSSTSGSFAKGGGIFASGNITLTQSVIKGNRTTGYNSNGGGVFAGGNATIDECVISGNVTRGRLSEGGGVAIAAEKQLFVGRSLVQGNSTGGIEAAGGGIDSTYSNLVLSESMISGNWTSGSHSYGGGIYGHNATVTNSTISGNHTWGANSRGGGMGVYGDVTIDHSTISGNFTHGLNAPGGGIWTRRKLSVFQSTITDNHAIGQYSVSGRVFQFNTGISRPIVLREAIVAGNTAATGAQDLERSPLSSLTIEFSVIGTGVVPTGGGNNIATDDPQLGPLAAHGGTTWTHALLPGSPALDAGDPAAMAGLNGVPLYDQRGNPFGRVYDGDGMGGARMDIGAFESQPIPPAVIGDYNADGMNDAADYVVWRKNVGATVTPFSGADGDGDGVIGQGDYGVWRAHFGAGGVGLGAGGIASGELGVGSGEGVQSRVERQESRAGVLVQAPSVNSNDMAVYAQGAMPVSKRLAHVAASFQDADGGVQAGVTEIAEVELSNRARGALAKPVAHASVEYTAACGAARDAALVEWLISRGRERNRGDEDPVGGARGDDQIESSAVLECADAVFGELERTLP